MVPIAGRGVVEGAAYGAGYGINEELITDPDATVVRFLQDSLVLLRVLCLVAFLAGHHGGLVQLHYLQEVSRRSKRCLQRYD